MTRTSQALLVASVALLAAVSPRICAEESDKPAERAFTFAYRVTIPAPPAGAGRLEAWIPLPIDDELQQVSELTIRSSVTHEETKDPLYGNRMLHVAVAEPKEPVTLGWSARIRRIEDRGQGKGPVLDRFREPDRLVPIGGKAARLAEKVGAKGEAPARDRAQKIYDEVLATMVYDKVAPGWGRGDFDRACEVGKGNCTDFHAKFMGVSRAAGIPARFTMGVSLGPPPKGNPAGYHCWAHFHDGANWLPVDASEAQKIRATDPDKAKWFFGHLDADRIALSVGRDLDLVPKQKGEPLQFFVYPYVEVDGKPFEVPKENRTFSYEDR